MEKMLIFKNIRLVPLHKRWSTKITISNWWWPNQSTQWQHSSWFNKTIKILLLLMIIQKKLLLISLVKGAAKYCCHTQTDCQDHLWLHLDSILASFCYCRKFWSITGKSSRSGTALRYSELQSLLRGIPWKLQLHIKKWES